MRRQVERFTIRSIPGRRHLAAAPPACSVTDVVGRSIDVGGSARTFGVAEPRAGEVAAVLLSLHGSRSTWARQARWSRMARLADAGAVVAFPEAVRPIGSGYEWDHERDLPFLEQLVGELISRYSPPGGRVCVTGMSGGARMSCVLASARADLVSAVGAVAGLRSGDGHIPTRSVPILAFHGTADRINPYAGGNTPRWDESVEESARHWAAANRMPEQPAVVAISPTLTRTTYGTEGEPGEVTLFTSKGAGHTWPGGHPGLFLRLFLGRTSTEIDATSTIWDFARAHAGEA
jgi:polyhydroxybutyrate depolymerase